MDFQRQYRRMNDAVAPDEALVSETLGLIASGKTRKTSRMRRIAAITAAAALVTACVTPALAANVPGVYEVLYTVSPAAAQFVMPVNESCEDQGVRMEVKSVAIEGDTAEVYVSLQDVSGTLFGYNAPDLCDSYSLNYPARFGQMCGCELQNYDVENSTATYKLIITNMENEAFRGEKYTFSIKEMLIGRQYQEGIAVDCDLSNVAVDPETEVRRINGSSSRDTDSEVFSLDEYAFLKPQGTPWQDEKGMFSTTATGYSNGQLHLQFQTNDALGYDNHAWYTLYAPDGSEVEEAYTVGYNDFESDISCQEFVYDIGYEELPECCLTADLYTASGKIKGDWRVTFEARK